MDHVASSHRKELATKLIDQSSHNDQSFSKSGYQLQQQANHHEMSLSYFDGGGSTNNHQYQLPVRNVINNDASPIVNLTNTLEYLNFSNSYATTSSTNTTANSSNSVATGNVAANSMNSYYEDQNKNFYNSQPPQNAGPSALDQAGANYNYQNCLKNNWQYSANSDYNHYYSNYNGSYYDTQHHLQLQQQQPQHQQHLAQGGASDRVSFYQVHQQDHYVQPEPCYNYDARPAAYSDCNYVSDTGTDQSRSTSYQLDTARTSGIATKPNDHAVSSSAWAPNSSFQTTKVAVNQLSGTAETEPIHKQTTNKAKTGPAIKPGESQQLNMGSSKRVKAKSIPNDDKLSSSSGAKSTSYDSNQQQQQRTNQCHVCGRLYARPSTLKTHLRTHTNERPFKCNVCSKTFSQAANLTAHQRVHTGERPFPCPICNRKFSQSSSVITHLRTHSGERPYKCSMCFRTFSDSSTLTKHCRIHSGEKPYQCDHCPLNFSQSGNLSRHLKLHQANGSVGLASKPTTNNGNPLAQHQFAMNKNSSSHHVNNR